MTDAEFLLAVLSDGQPHCLNEILRRSFAERGCGLTVHSRAADLRKRGHQVSHWKNGERGNGSWYSLEQATVDPPPVVCSSESLREAGAGGERAWSGEPAPVSRSDQLTLIRPGAFRSAG